MSDTLQEMARKVGKSCQYARKILQDDPEALAILDEALIDFGKLINCMIYLGSILRSLESRSPEEIRIALELCKAEIEKRKGEDVVIIH